MGSRSFWGRSVWCPLTRYPLSGDYWLEKTGTGLSTVTDQTEGFREVFSMHPWTSDPALGQSSPIWPDENFHSGHTHVVPPPVKVQFSGPQNFHPSRPSGVGNIRLPGSLSSQRGNISPPTTPRCSPLPWTGFDVPSRHYVGCSLGPDKCVKVVVWRGSVYVCNTEVSPTLLFL